MYEKEVLTKAWTVAPYLERETSKVSRISQEEQECHINILKVGDDFKGSSIEICCSHQGYITQLSKSKRFTLKRILVSCNPISKGAILEIQGSCDPKAITIRKV